MYLNFRWYDKDDSIPLGFIRQIPGIRGIVAALYDKRPGEPWPDEELSELRTNIEKENLEFRIVESIPVHESIKLGGPDRDRFIEAWISSMRAVARVLSPSKSANPEPVVITYNFMPVFDWTRSSLKKKLDDGSYSLAYDKSDVDSMNPLSSRLELPGWLAAYSREELEKLFRQYKDTDSEALYKNLLYFLNAVIPEAEKLNLRLAVHPDDPPWPIFGLPRVLGTAAALERLFNDIPSIANGLCFCTGSFGSSPKNDLVKMARNFAHRIHFAHLRNIKYTGDYSFQETAHWKGAGSIDLPAIISALKAGGFKGPVRPDHGRMIWGEEGRPGYGLYDRALGAQYIQGLIDAG